LRPLTTPARRELDKAIIRQLATSRWIAEHHNVILVGATGVGKSFIACALAHQARRKGYRAGHRRASRLFHELTLARADGTYVRLLGKLARLDVLLIDDWGLTPVQDQERRDLLAAFIAQVMPPPLRSRRLCLPRLPRPLDGEHLDDEARSRARAENVQTEEERRPLCGATPDPTKHGGSSPAEQRGPRRSDWPERGSDEGHPSAR
jgi:chromosomal replication initiation ATPase DnaA